MLRYHPVTGKPIRILKTETHLHKDQKTLVWLQNKTEQENNKILQRFNTITIGLDLIKKNIVTTFLILKDGETSEEINNKIQWLSSNQPRQYKLIFLSKKILEAGGFTAIQSLGHRNIICIEDLEDTYPFICPFSKEGSNSILILQIALILRFARIAGFSKEELQQTEIKDVIATYPIECLELDAINVKEFWLIQQYFKPEKPKRERELKKCLQKNMNNPFIDRIILLNEEEFSFEWLDGDQSKLKQVVIGNRLTYGDIIKWIQENIQHVNSTSVPIIGFTNADIYFDMSLKHLWEINMKDKFLSLLRYEESADPDTKAELYGPRPDSQDTWIVDSESVCKREWKLDELQFKFGQPGCDNAINMYFLRQKFIVANPCLNIKTYHVHQSGLRNYTNADIIDKPFYLYLEPTGLHDMHILKDLSSYSLKGIEQNKPFASTGNLNVTPFPRRIHGNSKQVKIFCNMLAKNGSEFKADDENIWTPPNSLNLYKFENAFQTQSGLVSGYSTIFVGDNKGLLKAWSEEAISPMTPAIGTVSSLAVHLPTEVANNTMDYITFYLSQILLLNEKRLFGEFWMPQNLRDLASTLQLFNWKQQQIPVVPYGKEDLQIVSESVYMLTPFWKEKNENVEIQTIFTMEMAAALRNMLKGYVLEYDTNEASALIIVGGGGKNMIDMKNGKVIKDELLKLGLVNVDILDMTVSPSASTIINLAVGKSLLICEAGYESFYWCLPKGAQIIELQHDLTPSAKGAHICGACETEYWILPIARGSKSDKINEQILSMVSERSQIIKNTDLPLVILPENNDGLEFYGLAKLWEIHNLCRIKKSSETPFCWFGETGKVLLYNESDNAADYGAELYEKILIGSDIALNMDKDYKEWTYWAKNPIILQNVIDEGISRAGYDDREKRILFYGTHKNTEDKKFNNNSSIGSWSQLCDEFIINNNSNDDDTYEQYLRVLANAKFSLCLDSDIHVKKNNHEIECMALGCVPVYIVNMNMKTYADPPQENIHYICVENLLDARRKLDAIDAQKWTEMSLACRDWWSRNASPYGSFQLTKKLAE